MKQHHVMNSQRQLSIFAIALLMGGLVIGLWLSTPTCYAPAPPYNETAVEERLDSIEETLAEMRGVIYEIKYGLFGARVIKTPIIPEPEPITNETDPVIIVTDPLEELASIQLQLENIYTWMIGHDTVLMGTRSSIRDLNATLNAKITDVEELTSKIGIMETTFETYSNEVNEQIVNLEDKVSGLQNTIMCMGIATIAIVIFSTYTLIKKGALKHESEDI